EVISLSQTEMDTRITATAKAISRQRQAAPAAGAGDKFYTGGEGITLSGNGPHPEPVIPPGRGGIAKKAKGGVNSICDEIDSAVAVEVAQGQAARVVDLRREIAATRGDIGEAAAAIPPQQQIVLRVCIPKGTEIGLRVDWPARHPAVGNRKIKIAVVVEID